MHLTILFDMDDTLLSNQVEVFIPAYVKSLSGFITHVPPEKLTSALLQASRQMVKKSQPAFTLEETFDSYFYPLIGFEKNQIIDWLDDFYRIEFPKLKPLTQPIPGVFEIVNTLINAGHQIVIATNPLFPATAIHQRLDWAGLNDLKKHFSLITTYETFHFSKPHPEFLTEILALLGWPDQPAILIGNSMEDDILPAEQIGLPTFHITDKDETRPIKNFHPLSSYGKHARLLEWIEQCSLYFSNHSFALDTAGLIHGLKATPLVFDTIIHHRLDDRSGNHPAEYLQEILNNDLSILNQSPVNNSSEISLSDSYDILLNNRLKLIEQIKNDKQQQLNPVKIFESDKKIIRSFLENQ